jgi:hypothetical protein
LSNPSDFLEAAEWADETGAASLRHGFPEESDKFTLAAAALRSFVGKPLCWWCEACESSTETPSTLLAHRLGPGNWCGACGNALTALHAAPKVGG